MSIKKAVMITADFLENSNRLKEIAKKFNCELIDLNSSRMKPKSLPCIQFFAQAGNPPVKQFYGKLNEQEIQSFLESYNRVNADKERHIPDLTKLKKLKSLLKSYPESEEKELCSTIYRSSSDRKAVDPPVFDALFQIYKGKVEDDSFRDLLVCAMNCVNEKENQLILCKFKYLTLDGFKPTPMKQRYLQRRRGGLPRRLLNGKWLWEGPHWSIKNKNSMKSGFNSNAFDKISSDY
jgi:hypothetical protein